MKCVILAAGEGLRMRPLTLETPKPLLQIGGRPILEWIVRELPDEITEIILVIGYKGEQIQRFCGNEFLGRKVRYVWQKEKLGTGHALKLSAPFIRNERFLLLYADDLHARFALSACLLHPRSLLVARHPEPQRFGVVTIRENGAIAGIVEKPAVPATNLISAGAMVLDQNIFSYEPERHPNGEYHLTTMIAKMLSEHPFTAVETKDWFPIATPEDLILAEHFLAVRAEA